MKVLKIDGRTAKVFVLKETEDSIVYIPVKSLFRVDYEILNDLESRGGELLKTLANEKLPNGRNGLVQYDNLIQVARYSDDTKQLSHRVRRPDEVFGLASGEQTVITKTEAPQPKEEEPKKPARRKPGPKPKAKK